MGVVASRRKRGSIRAFLGVTDFKNGDAAVPLEDRGGETLLSAESEPFYAPHVIVNADTGTAVTANKVTEEWDKSKAAATAVTARFTRVPVRAHRTSNDVANELWRMATKYQDQAAKLGEVPRTRRRTAAVEVGAVNSGRAWQLNHVDKSGDQENAACEHQDFSNVEAGEEKHSAHGYPQSSTRHRQDCAIGTAAKM